MSWIISHAISAVKSETPHPTPARQRASDDSLRQRLDLALRRNHKLATENQQLRRQLAHALGQLRDNPPRPRHDPITTRPC